MKPGWPFRIHAHECEENPYSSAGMCFLIITHRNRPEQQTNDFDRSRVHQETLSRVPLLSRADHRPPVRCLVAARRAVSAQGRINSSDHRTQSRVALTRWQCFKCSASTSGRSERRDSMMFRASSTPWLTPTSWSSSYSVRSSHEFSPHQDISRTQPNFMDQLLPP